MTNRQYPENEKACVALPSQQRLGSQASTSIPLFNCTVAGFQFYEGFRCIKTIRPGDRVDLVREPDNPHDKKAIAVHAPFDGKLGYLPRYLNEIPAVHLDSGKTLHALVNRVNRGAQPWNMLGITVVMA